MILFIGMGAGSFGFSGFIDWRRKKNDNTALKSMNPGARPGESANYQMGWGGNTHGDGF